MLQEISENVHVCHGLFLCLKTLWKSLFPILHIKSFSCPFLLTFSLSLPNIFHLVLTNIFSVNMMGYFFKIQLRRLGGHVHQFVLACINTNKYKSGTKKQDFPEMLCAISVPEDLQGILINL